MRFTVALLTLLVMGFPTEPRARSLVETNTVRSADRGSEVTTKRKRRRKKRRRHRRRWRPKFKQLNNGPGLHVLRPERAWGTKLTVARLRELTSAYHAAFPDAAPIWVHDISRRRGGRLFPHLSHRRGRDVDIRVIHKRFSTKYRQASPRTLHLAKNWFMLKYLIDTGDVELIFLDRRLQRALYKYARKQGYTRDDLRKIFQFPRNKRAIIRHWRGHADHIHVRFRRDTRPQPVG
jgi:murein endopeptidase